MTGHLPPPVIKPSRSDDVLDAAQQLQIYNQIRAQLDSLAPKRAMKPNRSDPDSVYTPDAVDIQIPELDKLRSLQSQSQAIISESIGLEQVEFVETDYYKALDSIEKQHHTTGTGFIKVVPTYEQGYEYDIEAENGRGGEFKEMMFKTNPARNDWIPN